MRTVDLETITDTPSWYRVWPLNGFSRTRVRQVRLRRRKGVYESFSSRRKKPNVVHIDNSLEIRKSCEDLSWNHRTPIPPSNRDGWRCVRFAASRKGRLLYCCNQAWMENGGLILWNANAICETFKISWQMGRHLIKKTIWTYRSVQWLNIIRFLQKTCQGFTNLVRKFYQEHTSGMHCSRAFWKGDILVADIEELGK